MPDPVDDRLDRLEAMLGEVIGRLDDPRPSQRYLSVDGAARYTDLSPESIRRLLASGRLTALRPCRGRILIDKQQLDAVVQGATVRPRVGRGIRKGAT